MTVPTNGPSGHGPAGPSSDAGSQYAYPSSASAPTAGGVALSDEPRPRSTGGRRRTGVLVGALAATLVLGAGGVFAYQQLSGSGAQPADVLPGDSYGYLRIDIDPSAGQKVAAVRFLGKLKDVRTTLGSDDPRKKLWESMTKGAGSDCVAKFSYDTDIAPWLGDRAGASIRPGGTSDKPNVAIAIQVTDEAAAQDRLSKLFACDSSGDSDVRLKDGYAIITPKGVGDATLAAAAKGTLAQNPAFAGDMGALGEQGVVSAWFDMASGIKEIKRLGGSEVDIDAAAVAKAKGRFAAALRFDAAYVELAGVVRGADATTAVKGDGTQLANLPANTMAALHVAGADKAIDNAWPTIEKSLGTVAGGDVLGGLEDQLGLTLPDDLKVLLGSSFTMALPAQDFKNDAPQIGAKVVSSDAKRAASLVEKLTQGATGSGDLTTVVDGDKVYVATTPDYADDLKTGGRLGDSEAFKEAVGDVSASNLVLYLDLDKIEPLYIKEMKGEERAVVETLRAIGLNASNTGTGEGTFTLRVLSN